MLEVCRKNQPGATDQADPGLAATVAKFSHRPSVICHGEHGLCSFQADRHVKLEGGHLIRKAAAHPPHLSADLALLLVGSRSSGYIIDGFSGIGIVGQKSRALSCTTRDLEIN